MRDILNSYTVTELRKHISTYNKSLGAVRGYSKMKKAQLIELMTKKENINKFKSIKMKVKPDKKTTTKTTTTTTTKREKSKDFIKFEKEINEYKTGKKKITLRRWKELRDKMGELDLKGYEVEEYRKMIKSVEPTTNKDLNIIREKLSDIRNEFRSSKDWSAVRSRKIVNKEVEKNNHKIKKLYMDLKPEYKKKLSKPFKKYYDLSSLVLNGKRYTAEYTGSSRANIYEMSDFIEDDITQLSNNIKNILENN